jgi:hypothetical protein
MNRFFRVPFSTHSFVDRFMEELLEAVACREALALTSDLGLQRLQIASDCLNLIKSIGGAGMGPHGQII